jgi:hypothetical protein
MSNLVGHLQQEKAIQTCIFFKEKKILSSKKAKCDFLPGRLGCGIRISANI